MDNAAIEEMFSALGPVMVKRMFGGKGIYFEGRILALEVGGDILLKADAEKVQRHSRRPAVRSGPMTARESR